MRDKITNLFINLLLLYRLFVPSNLFFLFFCPPTLSLNSPRAAKNEKLKLEAGKTHHQPLCRWCEIIMKLSIIITLLVLMFVAVCWWVLWRCLDTPEAQEMIFSIYDHFSLHHYRNEKYLNTVRNNPPTTKDSVRSFFCRRKFSVKFSFQHF